MDFFTSCLAITSRLETRLLLPFAVIGILSFSSLARTVAKFLKPLGLLDLPGLNRVRRGGLPRPTSEPARHKPGPGLGRTAAPDFQTVNNGFDFNALTGFCSLCYNLIAVVPPADFLVIFELSSRCQPFSQPPAPPKMRSAAI